MPPTDILQIIPAPPGWRAVFVDLEPPSLLRRLTSRTPHCQVSPVPAFALVEYREDERDEPMRWVKPLVLIDECLWIAEDPANFLCTLQPGEGPDRETEERALEHLAKLHAEAGGAA